MREARLVPYAGLVQIAVQYAEKRTSKSEGSGRETWVTSKKLKTFH